MIEFHDRRAEKEAREAARMEGGVELRTDGSIRRPGKGGRTLADFFDAEHHQRNLSRADYLNLRSMEEFSRRETRWWRRVWRFLVGDQQVRNYNRAMALAHERTLAQLSEVLKEGKS